MSVQIEKLNFDSYADAELALLPRLRGHVFHVTTPDGYEGIQRDGFIGSNLNEGYAFTTGQSKSSFFWLKGCVSLVDLRDISDDELSTGTQNYTFIAPFSPNLSSLTRMTVFLVLSNSAYQAIITCNDLAAMVVPQFEVGYLDKLPLCQIASVIQITITVSPFLLPFYETPQS